MQNLDIVSALVGPSLWTVLPFFLLAILLAVLRRFIAGPSPRQRRHARKQQSADGAFATLHSIGPRQNPAAAFGYLRKVDPFVFEEMILTELETRGHKIKRNKRYTGDGGADGAVIINGRHWLIQAKRYSGSVNAADVIAFDLLCRNEGARGLFVHTGRTTAGSRTTETASGYIRIISGEDLIGFFAGDSLRLAPGARDRRSPLPQSQQQDAKL